jgi:prepilin-type N-terminal cleavage/methylation domain-containing protein
LTDKTAFGAKRAARRGFQLVEVLIVVLIMGVLVGVVGSLMSGFISNFEVTDDQSIARRRAQDVFNILQMPVMYAGMGIPADHFSYYFSSVGGKGGAPIAGWAGPVSIIDASKASVASGKVLRVVYSISTATKHTVGTGSGDVAEFSGDTSGDVAPGAGVDLNLSASLAGLTSTNELVTSGDYNVHSYVTFPGIRMHPEIAVGYVNSPPVLKVIGKKPYTAIPSEDVLDRNVIRAYHDMYLVRAGVAYVDGNSTFCFADVTSSDTSLPNPMPLSGNINGYRVEGIKAIHFERDPIDLTKKVAGVTVYVIAEGDNAITGRPGAGSNSQNFRNEARWTGVTYEPDVYYEEFEMRWRTRNVEAPGA